MVWSLTREEISVACSVLQEHNTCVNIATVNRAINSHLRVPSISVIQSCSILHIKHRPFTSSVQIMSFDIDHTVETNCPLYARPQSVLLIVKHMFALVARGEMDVIPLHEDVSWA